MARLLYVLFVLIAGADTLKPQNPWLPLDFEVYWGIPRTFYWDKETDWFYVGGQIYIVDGKKTNRIFKVDSLSNVDYMDTTNVTTDIPRSIIKYKDTIYCVGLRGMFSYENSKWVSLFKDSTIPYPIFNCSYIYNGELFLGGRFKNVLGKGKDAYVIKYDGNHFDSFENISDVLGGINGQNNVAIADMIEYKGKFYIGGSFGKDSSDTYHNILSWNGLEWDALNGGIKPNTGWEGVSSFAVFKDELYVAGLFHTAEGALSNNILKYDGDQWYALGNGVYGYQIYELTVFKDELWAFGIIDSVDNLSLSKVAIWNGEYWCSPGGEINLEIFTAEEYRDTLYIGGNFQHIDYDSTLKHMVKYNENAPRKCSPSVEIIPIGIKQQKVTERLNVYPNPTSGQFTIKLEKTSTGELKIYNVLGSKVFQQSLLNTNSVDISLQESLVDGVYFVQFISNDVRSSQRLILKRE